MYIVAVSPTLLRALKSRPWIYAMVRSGTHAKIGYVEERVLFDQRLDCSFERKIVLLLQR
jgi:hypothetical protein